MNAAVPPLLLRRISACPAVAAWNSAIREAVTRKCFDEALHLFAQMRHSGYRPDWLTFPLILKSCANSSLDLSSSAVACHAAVLKFPFFSDVFVQTSLLNLYLKLRHLDSAAQLFDEMPQRDLPTWNTMLMGVSQLGSSLSSTVGFLLKMRLHGVSLDLVSFLLLAQACAAAESLPAARSCHSLAIISGAATDVAVKNTFLSCYSKCGDLASAESAFSEISLNDLTAVSWSSMITSYARQGKSAAAAACFSEMHRRHRGSLEASAAVSLLSVFALSAALRQGQAVHSLVITGGLVANPIIGNALISLYCKSGDLAGARRCFDGMDEKTSVSWSTMINGYASSRELSHAVDLFQAMENQDEFAVAAIVSGSSDELHLGRALHCRSTAAGLSNKTILCNSLMDMYFKNGCPKEAQAIFSAMETCRTVVSWTTMVSGFALNGYFRQALDLFRLMAGGLAGAPPPNAITFLAVLQACSHGGLLEEGLKYFAMMEGVFNLVPSLEHYACIVDLLGRKGRLREAMSFLEKMPVEPDTVAWGALLGACSGAGELELGEEAARRLQEMEPRAAAAYVPLANAYAARRQWGGMAAVLAAMRWRGARKIAGESSLQASGCLHRFSAQSGGHPETKYVEEMLWSLNAVMREEDSYLEPCGMPRETV